MPEIFIGMEDSFILYVTSAEYVHDYILKLTFNDSTVKLLDFTPLMQKGICRKLHDIDYFRNYTLDPFTVDWNNEIGFDPKSLYKLGVAVS